MLEIQQKKALFPGKNRQLRQQTLVTLIASAVGLRPVTNPENS